MTILVTPISDTSVVLDSAVKVVNLLTNFDDPRTTGLVARFELYNTSLAGGVTNIVLFDQPGEGAPLTVQNFRNYVEDGDYINSIIHRSVSGFVVQGGGFQVSDSDIIIPQELITEEDDVLNRVPTDPPVVNEFSVNRSNTRGTISMAKVGGNPDSATSQWFFNLADNSGGGPALDTQNGGFTVFGEVLSDDDLLVLETISELPILTGNANNLFGNLPLVVDLNNLPNNFTAGNFVRYRSITISEVDELAFRVVNNSNPSIVSASIVNNQLVLDPLPRRIGTASITVRATNLLGEIVDDTFLINITLPETTKDADRVTGSIEDDVIKGKGGSDRINGDDGNDRLLGGKGNDRLNGAAGNDELLGQDGNDRLLGNSGNDVLIGGKGNDTLKAGKGRDVLDGGAGSDVLIAGGNRDRFILSRGPGEDTIRGFRNRQDLLQARGVSFNRLTIFQERKNTIIKVGNDVLAELIGIQADTINRKDFG